ncbi:hypothetical protein BUALT_Bualt07G0039600 [Buddleja alternifolia]|uniref:BHLH domain-containing protein n=1 Tax=Buddleja alternifolia TaxID=168488 RepID=A0AAV6XIP4_9LAMI|nr:hypothetical protein BUALT_Bualt07G0039600 [Buddleja alternifolia]
MATANQNQNEVIPDNFRKQLAIAVRTIQWSYAIFWSTSSTQPGVLEWGDGYYNGDIKTRKTVQAVELNADQLGLQRSDQLRELFESLGETNPDAKRPTAALSPEDLTDAEWYFLVCMSFVFNIGQGLPGKSYAKNQTFWLCNAHRADTKVFSRSLLAKAKCLFLTLQTIVCFPHLGGVIELGATELVPEDLNLIQHIKTSFLECPLGIVSNVPNIITNNNEITYEGLDHGNMPENGLNQLLDCPNVDICTPGNSSNDFADNLLRDESNLAEGVDGEAASHIQSWPFMDDAISNCLNNSMNSSDCGSQTYENPETIAPFSDKNRDTNSSMHENQECNQHDASGSQGNDDVHYQSVLSNLLKSSHQLVLGPYFRNRNRESSFACWKKDRLSSPQTRTPQKLLKKVLFEVARMHENFRLESAKHNDNSRTEVDESDRNHVLSERKRREKINERFTILGSLVPSGGKVDKVSILDHTIEYLRELERKVEELESHKEAMVLESTTKSKPQDAIERTSDNYGPNKVGKMKKTSRNKRKACDMDKTEGNNRARLRDSLTDDITVIVTGKDVLIELRCSWRECVLIDVMEAISKLNMESQSVQSSNADGIFSMTIKAKCKGLKGASSGVIKQALQKVMRKC